MTPGKAGVASAGPGPRGIQSIETGYRILVAIQMGPGAVALKDVASRAGIAPSAAHNYLTSFVRTGMVKSEGRGMYRLGPSLAALGMTAARDVDHFELVRTAASQLSEETGLGVAVVIWSNGPVILFNQSAVRGRVFDLRNGPVEMLHTAAGHVFAAYLPDAMALPVLARELKADGVFRNLREAQGRLEKIRADVLARGYALVELRALPTYLAVSVPVWNTHGEVAYGLTITSPASLLDTRARSPQIRALRAKGHELSRLLGAPAERWAP
ncbi:MAG: helix-turn-helix domain-containing protein [Pigmentiphaga sp.]|uniref:IclR family transcriptional regulator n=1 Tax=Pigmentiphaga sp. TaxID=1977564 RepID=UPI0029B9E06A|nr:helix-turn-helix domain-containing protein [Pigmentiphaga sp.]MDX3908080.1 helix-turn-helix domain-containing protein [Pigmentiphaga sp.]